MNRSTGAGAVMNRLVRLAIAGKADDPGWLSYAARRGG